MKSIPLNIQKIHFVGVGGIGMSGIAEVMHSLGYQIQGSDILENANIVRLKSLGISVMLGQAKENIRGAGVVVVSTAIRPDNPELVAARELLIPVVRRAEMLAELMRFKWSVAVGGTHGKTTTTSMIAAVMDAAAFDPTVINGGIINAYKTNARLGGGDWMVVEADESDGTFVKLPATIAVVTNIDPEHLDFYGDFDSEKTAFQSFVQNIPFYGFAAMCVDHPEVQALCSKIVDRRIITYGLSPAADIRAENIKFMDGMSIYDVVIRKPGSSDERVKDVKIRMPGKHNVQNSLAAFVVGIETGIDQATIARGLENFSGVKRRFTFVGQVSNVTIVDDYAHHPVEIRAVLEAARCITKGRIIAVMQPHRYSRLNTLFEDFCTSFNEADTVIVTEVYAAGELSIEGVNRDSLCDGIKAHGHRHVLPLTHEGELASCLATLVQAGDTVICIGAGSITNWAQRLPEELSVLLESQSLLQVMP